MPHRRDVNYRNLHYKERKFTDEEVREIRQDARDGVSRTALAAKHKVGYTTISNLIRRDTYGWVEDY